MALNPDDPLTRLTGQINAAAIDVHDAFGPGLLESAYQPCMQVALARRGLKFKRQVAVPLIYEGIEVSCGYRLDLVVEDRVIVEIKSVDRIAPIHEAQMITYLKLTGFPVGLILNFNVPHMKQGIRRLENRFLPKQLPDILL